MIYCDCLRRLALDWQRFELSSTYLYWVSYLSRWVAAAGAAAAAATKTRKERVEIMTPRLARNMRWTKFRSCRFPSRQHVAQTTPSRRVSTKLHTELYHLDSEPVVNVSSSFPEKNIVVYFSLTADWLLWQTAKQLNAKIAPLPVNTHECSMVMRSVASMCVCLFVCVSLCQCVFPVYAVTFESLYLESSFLVCSYIFQNI